MTKSERLELIRWLIERNDHQRASVASRAAIVVSADALFLGGITFLLDNALTMQNASLLQLFLLVCICVTVLLLVFSLAFATTGIINWKISRKALVRDDHLKLFFRPHDTVIAFKGFGDYEEAFTKTSQAQLTRYALGHLWAMQNLFRDRYHALQKAIVFLLFSIVSFIASIAILLLSNI